ncbi:MAG: invasin domain 3-containing protein, partial [Armatimonadota bacterium]|nr:invasin domain 3-containing protein [Armatimonadota bacterium]
MNVVMNPLAVSLVADKERLKADGRDSTIVRARVMDVANNVVDGVEVEFSVDNGQINPKVAKLVNGEATATLVASNVSGVANVRVRVLRYVATAQVTYVPVDIAKVLVAAAPIEIPVGGASSDITVTVLDSSNRPVDGANVAFLTDKGYIVVLNATTDVNGQAMARLFSDTTVGEATVTARARYEGREVAGQFKVRFIPGDVARITLEVRNSRNEVIDPNQNPAVAGVNAYRVVAYVTDRYGNPVIDGTQLTWTLPGGFTQSAPGGTSTTENGRSENEIMSTVASVGNVRVTSGGVSATVFLTFVPGPPALVNVQALPNIIEAGVGEALITAVAFDANGNLINFEFGRTPGAPPNLYLIRGKRSVDYVFTTNAGLLEDFETGADHEIGTTVTVKGDTIVDNNAVAKVRLRAGGTANTTATITVKVGTVTGTAQVTFVPSEANQIRVIAQPQKLPGNMIATSVLRAEVRDVKGNPVRDETPVQFTISSGNIDDGVFLPSTGTRQTVLTTGGVATVVYRSGLNILDSDKNVQIEVESGAAKLNYVLTLLSSKPHSATLSAMPTLIPATGVSTSTITAVVRDVNGNPVPIGTVVRFETNRGTFVNSVSPDGKLAESETDSNGVATAVLTSEARSGIANVVVKQVVVNGRTINLVQTGSTIVQMVGLGATVTLTTDRANLPADGASYATIVATLRDIQGKPIEGASVRFTTTNGILKTITGDELPPDGVVTDQNGVASVRLYASANPGIATVTASVVHDGVLAVGRQVIMFNPVAIRLSIDPQILQANGTSKASVRAFLQDSATGVPVADGILVDFRTDNGQVNPARSE